MKKILITGAGGMLASDFLRYGGKHFTLVGLTKEELDITNLGMVEQKIKDIQPDFVLNCAAYTQVDAAENVGKELCYAVNTLGVRNLAMVTAQQGIDFISLSTDYVFDGTKPSGYYEHDVCNPVNEYGTSKYQGECQAFQVNPHTIIIRTSWLYGGGVEHHNFVNTMLSLGKTNKEITVVSDQFGCPTSCRDLVGALEQVIQHVDKYRGSVLHFTNTTPKEGVSWYDFAQKIFYLAKKEVYIIPCSYNTYGPPTKRPKNSHLINTSDIQLRNWEEGLQEYLNRIS